MYRVQDIMTEEVVVVPPTATINTAISLMIDHEVSGLPVVDDDRTLLGVITELDIIDLVYDADIDTALVADYMTTEVNSLTVDASLDAAASIFCSHSIRRIPVVNGQKLVGVVSRRDLIGFVRNVRREGIPA